MKYPTAVDFSALTNKWSVVESTRKIITGIFLMVVHSSMLLPNETRSPSIGMIKLGPSSKVERKKEKFGVNPAPYMEPWSNYWNNEWS